MDNRNNFIDIGNELMNIKNDFSDNGIDSADNREGLAILGAGQFGEACLNLINQSCTKVLAFGDNSPSLQGTAIRNIPVLSVEQAVAKNPCIILIAVKGTDRAQSLKRQAAEAGFHGSFLLLDDLMNRFDIRKASVIRMAERIKELDIPGDIAELGVFRGELSRELNALFPNRTLHLFDTFEGFDSRDIDREKAGGFSMARENDFSDTSMEAVEKRMPFPETVRFHKGYFPETAEGLENCRFYLVSLDADLYAPTLAGIEFFYPRLLSGGMIVLHDYNSRRFRGAKKAVEAYEAAHGPLLLVPLSDLHGSAVIIRTDSRIL